jgi:hypothetical protein
MIDSGYVGSFMMGSPLLVAELGQTVKPRWVVIVIVLVAGWLRHVI